MPVLPPSTILTSRKILLILLTLALAGFFSIGRATPLYAHGGEGTLTPECVSAFLKHYDHSAAEGKENSRSVVRYKVRKAYKDDARQKIYCNSVQTLIINIDNISDLNLEATQGANPTFTLARLDSGLRVNSADDDEPSLIDSGRGIRMVLVYDGNAVLAPGQDATFEDDAGNRATVTTGLHGNGIADVSSRIEVVNDVVSGEPNWIYVWVKNDGPDRSKIVTNIRVKNNLEIFGTIPPTAGEVEASQGDDFTQFRWVISEEEAQVGVEYAFVIEVTPTTGRYKIVSRAHGDKFDPDRGNNMDKIKDTIIIRNLPDYAAFVEVMPDSPKVGEEVVVFATVTNEGEGDGTEPVQVQIRISSGFRVNSAPDDCAAFDNNDGDTEIHCEIAPVPAGGVDSVRITGTFEEAGTGIVKTIVILSDGNNTNNESTVEVVVNPSDSGIDLEFYPPTPNLEMVVGVNSKLTFQFTNSSTITATNFHAVFVIGGVAVDFSRAYTSKGQIQQNEDGAALDVPTLEPGESVTVEIDVTASEPGTLHVNTTASADQFSAVRQDVDLRVILDQDPPDVTIESGPDVIVKGSDDRPEIKGSIDNSDGIAQGVDLVIRGNSDNLGLVYHIDAVLIDGQALPLEECILDSKVDSIALRCPIQVAQQSSRALTIVWGKTEIFDPSRSGAEGDLVVIIGTENSEGGGQSQAPSLTIPIECPELEVSLGDGLPDTIYVGDLGGTLYLNVDLNSSVNTTATVEFQYTAILGQIDVLVEDSEFDGVPLTEDQIETTYSRVGDILVRMKDLAVQAGSGQLSTTERVTLANGIDEAIYRLVVTFQTPGGTVSTERTINILREPDEPICFDPASGALNCSADPNCCVTEPNCANDPVCADIP